MAKKSKRQRAEMNQKPPVEQGASTEPPVEAQIPEQPQPVKPATQAKLFREEHTKLWPSLAIGVLVFLGVLYFAAFDTPFFVALPFCILAVGVIGAFLKWKPTKHVTVTAVLFLAFVLLSGAASLYSDFQDFAVEAFAKWLCMFAIFLMAVIACRKKHVRTLLVGIAAGIALTAIFSIDSASFRKITDFVIGTIMRVETSGFSYWGDGRISGLFTNPNISASMFALGIFLSLYVTRTAKSLAERVVGYASLAFSALAFLLSFSMGSIGFFVVGVVVYLVAADKEERLGLFILMVETGLVTLVFGVLSTLGLGKEGAVTLIPDIAMVLSALVLWQLDTHVGIRLAEKMNANRKAVAVVFGAVGAAAVLYVVLGFNLTGGMSFDPGESISRSAYPAAGEYTLAVEGPDDLWVKVTTQNSQEIPMHTSTTVYEGAAAGARFSVSEGTRVAYFELGTDRGGEVNAVSYSGADNGSLKLKYLILPEFAATRIQGLWANQNVIQRLTFFEDALKIWKMNPAFGMGMGAFEAYRPQVADFAYVTRYTHNVYFQTMAETGLIGIALLLGMVACFFIGAIRGRKDEQYGAMAAPLLACLAMMWGHGTFEVIWSSKPYLLVTGLILAMIQVCFRERLQFKVLEQTAVRRGIVAVCGIMAVAFGVLLTLQPIYQAKIERAKLLSYEEFMNTAREGVRVDVYESDFFRATFLKSAFIKEDEGFLQIADGYAAKLAESNTYAYGVCAADYYFERGETENAFYALEKAALRGKADFQSWDAVVTSAMENYVEGDDVMREGMENLYRLWKEIDTAQADDIILSEGPRAFLNKFGNH